MPALDGWRGIAILLVLINHFLKETPNRLLIGQHGVNIFFVLSGFLITSKLIRERNASGTIDLRHFYTRRFFRLMPGAWLYMAFLAAVGMLQPKEAVACLFFFRHLTDFGSHSVTVHFWSLSVEEDFYLVWPAALLILSDRPALLLAASTVAFIGSGIGAGSPLIWMAQHMEVMPLLVGCITAYAPSSGILHPNLRNPMLVASIIGIAICVSSFHTHNIPLSELFLIALSIWITASGEPKLVLRILDSKLLAGLGVISYSVYIWQTGFGILDLRTGVYIPPLVQGIGAIAIGFLMYRFIEQPCRNFGRRLTTSRTKLARQMPHPERDLCV